MADSVIRRYSASAAKWHYEHGLALKAVEQVWHQTGDDRYWRFIQDTLDSLIAPDGDIRTYSITEYNLDQINPGKMLFPLYRTTGEKKYKQAIERLKTQLNWQPRTHAGGFWHKLIYPYQMWLDGVYMAAPFYAEYAKLFDEPQGFYDVAHQIVLIEKQTRDPQTGLLYHAWDESKQQRWANPETGCSPHFWGRAIGWYAMALVDVLDYLPGDYPQQPAIIDILRRLAQALAAVQEPTTGLWYQVLDQGDRAGNYLEASASCMFVYALAKGIRKNYLPPDYRNVAEQGYRGILANLVTQDEAGLVNLERICGVGGLGGTPYRDGSFEYYISEKVVTNDYKGIGPFILAAIEMENSKTRRP